LAERETQRLARLTRVNQRRLASGLEAVESLDAIKEEEQPDILLDQATEIVTDLAGLDDEPHDSVMSSVNKP